MKRTESVLVGLVCAFLCALFLYLCVYSLFFTTIIEEAHYISEPMVQVSDQVLLNLGMLVLGAALLWLFGKLERFVPMKAAVWLVLALTLAAGSFWVVAARAIPRADANNIFVAAQRVMANNFSELRRASGYFSQHPYQVGFLSLSEILQRIFGAGNFVALQVWNAVFLSAAYGGVLLLTWRMTEKERVVKYAALLLLLCLQPVLYCTFLYGNIASIACSLWAACLTLSAVKRFSPWKLLGAGLLCGLSVLYKPNGWIPTIALAGMTGLWLISEKKWRLTPFLAVFLLLPLLVTGGVKAVYSARGKADLSKGVPMTAYLAMGLQESSRAPGWYNEYVDRVYKSSNYSPERASEKALRNIRMRLDTFAEDPSYAVRFFHEKMVSQWNEPTFQSIWISRVCRYGKERLPFAKAVLDGNLRKPVETYMEGYTTLLYTCFCLGLFLFACGLLQRKSEVNRPYGFGMGYLAVTVFGAFLYHMLFEAKAQYLFIYLLLLIPVAATAAGKITFPRRS